MIRASVARIQAGMAALVLLGGCGGGGGGGEAVTAGSSAVTVVPAATPTPAPAPTPTPTATATDSLSLPVDAAATTLLVDPAAIAVRSQPFLLGVGTHFPGASAIGYDPASSARAIADLSLGSFRDDIYWPIFDPRGTGTTATIPARLTDFMARTTARPLLILNQGNANVAGTTPPVTDAGRAAFADFASRAVRAVARPSAMFEVWNEWNHQSAPGRGALVGAGDDGDPRSAAQYAALAVAAGRAVKAADPGARVLVGAAGDDNGWLWSRAVVERGGLAYADGFSVHLYNHCNAVKDRTATNLIDRLTGLRTTLASANGGRDVPIYVTEWGWPTVDPECGGVPDSVAGPNIAQFSLFMAGSPWVAGGWLYELKDESATPADREASFGLYGWDYADKPRTCFYREAAKIIADAQAIEVQRTAADIFVAKVRTATGFSLIGWTSDAATTARITVGGTISYAARPMCGQKSDTQSRTSTFSSTPMVLTLTTSQPVAFQIRKL